MLIATSMPDSAMRAKSLPLLLCYPIVRRFDMRSLILQWSTTTPVVVECWLNDQLRDGQLHSVRLGEHCWQYWWHIDLAQSDLPLPRYYRLRLHADELPAWDSADSVELHYGSANGIDKTPEHTPPEHTPPAAMSSIGSTLRLPDITELTTLAHGSCRHPYRRLNPGVRLAELYSDPDTVLRCADGDVPLNHDGLVALDAYNVNQAKAGLPLNQLLLLSGDQIYADDSPAAMLLAARQLSSRLGLYTEIDFPLWQSPALYQRKASFDKTRWQDFPFWHWRRWYKVDDSVISSFRGDNHVIALDEFLAVYLLSWSALPWQLLDEQWQEPPVGLSEMANRLFRQELAGLKEFIVGLSCASRVMANTPTYMMFDDHDITDDWNLHALWQQRAMACTQAQRMISNGLLAFWLFAGAGNDSQCLATLLPLVDHASGEAGWDMATLRGRLLQFNHWHFHIDYQPKIVVLDTRTQRWISHHNDCRPSGLMDLQRLLELEQQLVGQQQVIIVSPAPVFGVKSIESLQQLAAALGGALWCDVENWMAHKAAAKKLLAIFARNDTPTETLILSGDVHYSFCSSIKERFDDCPNRIWQLTSSGIRNRFPERALTLFDRVEQRLFSRYSLANVFTKRRAMSVRTHPLQGSNRRLVNAENISLVVLDSEHKLAGYQLLTYPEQPLSFDLQLDQVRE